MPELREAFDDRLYALYARHLRADEPERERELRATAKKLAAPTVAAVETLYHEAERKPLHDVICCIREGPVLSAAGKRLPPNGEHYLKSVAAMNALFADDPVSLARTWEVAKRCDFSLSDLRYRYPAENCLGGSASDYLRELTMQGARQRYSDEIPAAVLEQLQRELALIAELDYGGYFLTMFEIVQFCRRENILCQGRGSAANSAVCFCLGITAIDPVKLDLLFERFISRERAEPPDIDLDIEHRRREEVIQFVYHRYGRRHAAMVANFIRYRRRSAVRDVGRALGLPLPAIDRLCKLLGGYLGELDETAMARAGLDPSSDICRHLLPLAQQIRGLPRHLSIHPGGFLLGREPVDTLVPIEPAQMPERTVIQWDKQAVEDLGLFKVDLLGLGALTQIHQCFDLIERHEGVKLELATIPSEDPETYRMISRADTVGVFQIESRAQMSMLPRLRPRTFYDLVMEVAIVRPGPIQGNMVHPYLNRRNRREKVEYPHPSLERILSKTLGVPIFQEQVMKIAVLAGGYTPGEADQLRRDMSAWRSTGRIERHRDRLIGRMTANGIPIDFAERIFSQIRGFGEYGFPESHAASFAVLVYAAAWLHRHYPAAFTCALLNAQPMGFYSPSTIVQDAQRHGVEMRPIDVQNSNWNCTLEETGCRQAVRMGIRYVKGLGEREKSAFERAPAPYRDLTDLVVRTGLSPKALSALAQAGALQSLIKEPAIAGEANTLDRSRRRDTLWKMREIISRARDGLPLPATDSETRLFPPLSFTEEIRWDYRAGGHSTCGHPLLEIRGELRARAICTAAEINALPDGAPARYAGLVVCRQQPGTARKVTFYTLEDETGFVNLVVWFPVYGSYATLARTALLLGATGRMQSQQGVVYLIADQLWDPSIAFHPEGTSSRDYR